MKKLLFLFSSVILLSSLPSCKQCGYCRDSSGYNGSAVCKESSVLGSVLNNYDEAKANCQAQGGTWTKTK
jgi:hypothetical protein